MNNNRLPAVPLITHDPYFSVWSMSDKLNESETHLWTGREEKAIWGDVEIDGKTYRFMGKAQDNAISQTDFYVTPTKSVYTFEGYGVNMVVEFLSPLLLTDLELVSRPCSYITVSVKSVDDKEHAVKVVIKFDETHCYHGNVQPALRGGVHKFNNFDAAWMGQKKQAPLNHSGDGVSIDWGYLYLAVPTQNGEACFCNDERKGICGTINFGMVQSVKTNFFVAAYDDIASIMYFGDICKAYWAKDGKTITEAIGDAVRDYRILKNKCEMFDKKLTEDAIKAGGEDYAFIVAAAYRQAISAHKLIEDKEGNVIYLSKENYSNGCIGTVDVSYPSIPLFLMYAPELVKGMMLPVLKFAKMPVWKYDFAPHDVGRYPYVNGQVYSLKNYDTGEYDVFPPYYLYPETADIFDDRHQMPVEECGNMLVMAAAYALESGCACYLDNDMDTLEKWVNYLIEFGEDPGDQLCTDDFAGHLAHNINLAAKAIMGVEAYSIILNMRDKTEESEWFHAKAAEMACNWEKNSKLDDHTAITFGDKKGWSLKYNTVWDIVFGSELFSQDMFKNEIQWYINVQNEFGVPLDSRRNYTKSDWIAWSATMTDDIETRKKIFAPMAKFLRESQSHVPFSDFYDTVTGKQEAFQARSVQGGLFMPLFQARNLKKD